MDESATGSANLWSSISKRPWPSQDSQKRYRVCHDSDPRTNANSRAETPRDYQAVVHILDRVSSVRLTPEEVEYGVTSEPGSVLLVAELDGVDVASGLGKRSTIAGAQYTMIRVIPEARRRGIGQALYEALSASGRNQDLADAWGQRPGDDTDSLGFAERRGFSEFQP